MNTQNLNIFALAVCILLATAVTAQRPSYAGSRPQSGYKDRLRPITEAPPQQDIVNRFGDDPNRVQRPPISGSSVVQPINSFIPINDPISNQLPDLSNRNSFDSATSRLPYDALGDREIVDRLNRLPVDQRPFWLINAQAIEAHRNRTAAQVGNFNPTAVRGSFAGIGSLSGIGSVQLPPQQPQQPQQQTLLSSRGDFGSQSQSDFGVNRVPVPTLVSAASRLNPSLLNRVQQQPQLPFIGPPAAAAPARQTDSQGGRFVYVGPELYETLRRSNLVA